MSRARPTAREIYLSPAAGRSDSECEHIEREFFSRVRLKNGVFKTTTACRFGDLNRLVGRLLPRCGPLQLMDVAISSGVSTMEWMHDLETAGISHHMVGGDSCLRAILVSVGRHFEAVVDLDGYPLHFDVLGRGMPNTADALLPSMVTAALRVGLATILGVQPGLRASLKDSTDAPFRSCFVESVPISLVSPRLRASPTLELVEDNILTNCDQRLLRRFHALRAANVLNPKYFDAGTLSQMLRNLRARLVPDGLLIVCRSDSAGVNHATVLGLKNGALKVVARLGRGSEIESLALALD